ncbi:hypothetical protein ABZ676_13575, partial [Streptomyces sp. NPDC006999]
IVSEIIPVFSRKPIFGYMGLIGATIAIAGLSVSQSSSLVHLLWAPPLLFRRQPPQLTHRAPGAAPPDPRLRPERPRPQASPSSSSREVPPDGLPVVAVAGGAAFTFSYAEQAELLAAAGADVVVFDPLRDEELPDGARGLVVGGGFPEVYASELSANERLRKAVGALAERGAPVAAECAGLLYLCRELDGLSMCGVLDASARMTGRLTLGYRDAVAVSDSVLAGAGARMRGHEFHRTVVEPGAGGAPAWGVRTPAPRVEGFVQRGVHASYLHTHWASEPGVARRFVERCRTS